MDFIFLISAVCILKFDTVSESRDEKKPVRSRIPSPCQFRIVLLCMLMFYLVYFKYANCWWVSPLFPMRNCTMALPVLLSKSGLIFFYLFSPLYNSLPSTFYNTLHYVKYFNIITSMWYIVKQPCLHSALL